MWLRRIHRDQREGFESGNVLIAPTPGKEGLAMTSVEDVIGSLSADLDALQEIQARIEEARAEAEELHAQLQATGLVAGANAIGAGKEQLVECATMAAALVNQVEAARNAAMAEG